VPPARSLVYTSTSTTGILNAAQINLDNPNVVTDDSPSAWVANRGNVNVVPNLPGSIIKLNLVQPGSGNVIRATPQAVEQYRLFIDPVRGIAPEYAPAINTAGAGGNYTKFVWVTTNSGIQVYRAQREIRVKIWIANHAGLGFANLPAVTQAQLTQWIQDSLNFANNDFAQIGFQIKVDPVFGTLDDDNQNLKDYSVAFLDDNQVNCSPTLTAWANANTPDLYTIHVFITHGQRTLNGDAVDDRSLGVSAQNQFVNCGGRLLRYSLVGYGSNLTPARASGTPRVSNSGVAHELGHDLIDYTKAKAGQFDAPDGHKSNPNHLMYSENQFSRVLWDADDDDLINYPASPFISLFFPEGGAP
jgi:hypothetical protein